MRQIKNDSHPRKGGNPGNTSICSHFTNPLLVESINGIRFIIAFGIGKLHLTSALNPPIIIRSTLLPNYKKSLHQDADFLLESLLIF